MILKVMCDDYASVIGEPGWTYYDRISKVRTYGECIRPATILREWNPGESSVLPPGPPNEDTRRISLTRAELRAWVDQAFGIDRSAFADELWPEFPDDAAQRTVTCVHLTRDDGSMILALVAGSTYLLSDQGDTVDRLR